MSRSYKKATLAALAVLACIGSGVVSAYAQGTGPLIFRERISDSTQITITPGDETTYVEAMSFDADLGAMCGDTFSTTLYSNVQRMSGSGTNITLPGMSEDGISISWQKASSASGPWSAAATANIGDYVRLVFSGAFTVGNDLGTTTFTLGGNNGHDYRVDVTDDASSAISLAGLPASLKTIVAGEVSSADNPSMGFSNPIRVEAGCAATLDMEYFAPGSPNAPYGTAQFRIPSLSTGWVSSYAFAAATASTDLEIRIQNTNDFNRYEDWGNNVLNNASTLKGPSIRFNETVSGNTSEISTMAIDLQVNHLAGSVYLPPDCEAIDKAYDDGHSDWPVLMSNGEHMIFPPQDSLNGTRESRGVSCQYDGSAFGGNGGYLTYMWRWENVAPSSAFAGISHYKTKYVTPSAHPSAFYIHDCYGTHLVPTSTLSCTASSNVGATRHLYFSGGSASSDTNAPSTCFSSASAGVGGPRSSPIGMTKADETICAQADGGEINDMTGHRYARDLLVPTAADQCAPVSGPTPVPTPNASDDHYQTFTCNGWETLD